MQDNKLKIEKNPPLKPRGIFCYRLVACLALLLLSIPCLSQAKLEIPESRKQFGNVQRGTVLTHSYEIKNTGNVPLIVKSYDVACSCTSAGLPAEPIAPGKSAVITVTFDTKSVYGRQDRIVTIHSNDPGSPHKLRFKANVSKE